MKSKNNNNNHKKNNKNNNINNNKNNTNNKLVEESKKSYSFPPVLFVIVLAIDLVALIAFTITMIIMEFKFYEILLATSFFYLVAAILVVALIYRLTIIKERKMENKKK